LVWIGATGDEEIIGAAVVKGVVRVCGGTARRAPKPGLVGSREPNELRR
jgi:hypothetical protein